MTKKEFLQKAALMLLAVCLLAVLIYPQQFRQLLSGITAVIMPILLGFCFAYFLNVPMRAMERRWDYLAKGKFAGLRRFTCLILTYILLLGILSAICLVVLPKIGVTVRLFAESVPGYINTLAGLWESLSLFMAEHGVYLPELNVDTRRMLEWVSEYASTNGQLFVDRTVEFTTGFISALLNVVLGLVFSIYMLFNKEKFCGQVRRMAEVTLPQKRMLRMQEVLSLSDQSFSNFITGQLTEAVILGTLCFIGMSIFRFPHAFVISVLICFTALIPIFGALIGTVAGAFLILTVSPLKAVWFVVFLLILQQIEGNLIYPRVVGKSVGLPGFWVLVAVTVGGNAFGVLGMLMGVPVLSVIYTLCRQYVVKKKRAAKAVAPDKTADLGENTEKPELSAVKE